MNRFVTASWLLAVLLSVAGCASGARATDPPAIAVREAHSAVAGLVFALGIQLEQRTTEQVTQVSLEQCLEDVGAAQQELLTATDADPDRRTAASRAVSAAADALVALGPKRAGELDVRDLARLEQVERDLAAAAQGLGA